MHVKLVKMGKKRLARWNNIFTRVIKVRFEVRETCLIISTIQKYECKILLIILCIFMMIFYAKTPLTIRPETLCSDVINNVTFTNGGKTAFYFKLQINANLKSCDK